MPVSPPAPHAVPQAQRELRLRLKPAGSTSGYVDGAWWPRSRDLTAEVPALATVLAVRLGSVWRVVYPLVAWDTAPTRIRHDGHPIRLEGFHSQDEHAITVVSLDARRIRLLVIPPDTDETTGHDVLMAATRRDNADAPATILTEAGILRPSIPMPEPREAQEQR
jgi:Family of unknown function (DUF5994)